MKKISTVLFLAICYLTGHCTEPVEIHGHISHPISDSVRATYSTMYIPFSIKQFGGKLDKDGNFNLAIDVPEGYTKVQIDHGGQETEIYAHPGTDLVMEVDAARFDSSLHYAGEGSEIANFMARHTLEHQSMLHFNIRLQMVFGKEPKEFEAAANDMAAAETRCIEAHGQNLPKDFKDYFKNYYRYAVYSAMEMYPRMHEIIRQKINNITDIPKENYAVVNDIPEAFDDRYTNMEAYYSYVANYFYSKIALTAAGNGARRPAPTPTDSILALAYSRMPPKTAEQFASTLIYHATKYNSIDKEEQEYADYKTRFPNSKNLKELRIAIEVKKTIAVGKPAIDFDINTPEGKKLKLSDLKGTVVYIDFWSSGCVPCIAEMPDAKKVETHFKDKPVSFVNISLDQHDAAWKQAISMYEIGGINTRTDGFWESDIVKKYGVKGTPSYFLIDKDGKFAVVEDIARPSNSEKLIAQIEKLLK